MRDAIDRWLQAHRGRFADDLKSRAYVAWSEAERPPGASRARPLATRFPGVPPDVLHAWTAEFARVHAFAMSAAAAGDGSRRFREFTSAVRQRFPFMTRAAVTEAWSRAMYLQH